jgi:glycosyltransferase involved in cell wall biosynthesis
MDKFKNPLLFLDLAEQLASNPTLQSSHFILAGSGHLEKVIQQRVLSSPIRERIHLLGHRQDVAELLAISDLAVCLPQTEGFGMSVLESITTGTPCLSFAVGGIPEILNFPGDESLLVQSDNMAELVHKATHLLQQPLDRQIALSATLRQRAERFDIRFLVSHLKRVYYRIRLNQAPLIQPERDLARTPLHTLSINRGQTALAALNS